jgi:hypothetical protein
MNRRELLRHFNNHGCELAAPFLFAEVFRTLTYDSVGTDSFEQ